MSQKVNGWSNWETWNWRMWAFDDMCAHVLENIDDDEEFAERFKNDKSDALTECWEQCEQFDELLFESVNKEDTNDFVLSILDGYRRDVNWRELSEALYDTIQTHFKYQEQ